MVEDIVHEATYPYPPAEVWRALTSPTAMGAWLMQTTFERPEVGHAFEFRDKPRMGWSGVTRCVVEEVVAERRFVIRFGDAADGFPATRVEWDLEPATGGTRVRLRHSGFTGFKGWMMRQGMANGWGRILRHSIPYVIRAAQAGKTPARDEVKAYANAAEREARHGPRAPAPPGAR